MESVSEWSGLVPNVLLQIASKLTVLEDFMALRGVCTSWRSCVTRDKFACVSKVPLLMLAEKKGNDDVREFYSLCKKRVCMRMAFPEAREKRCLDAGFGWILIAPARNYDGQLNLVRLRPPVNSSHLKIQLPDTTALPGYTSVYGDHYIQRAVLSANPSETSDFVLIVCSNNSLASWKKGNNRWTGIYIQVHTRLTPTSICYYKQKFHILDLTTRYLYVWDPSATDTLAEPLVSLSKNFEPYMRPYLVVSNKGELLLIMRNKIFDDAAADPFGDAHFSVVQIDIEKRVGGYIYSLDGDAIFVGLNSALSVSAHDFPGLIKPNHIYFTDDYTEIFNPLVKGGMEMGIYNIEDGSSEKFDVQSYSHVCPPVWIFPS